MMKLIIITSIVLVSCLHIETARILGVFPAPSISHQVVFRNVYMELVKKGHELVVITPNPMYNTETSPKNLKEIDISGVYNKTIDRNNPFWKSVKRGVIMDSKVWTTSNSILNTGKDIFKFEEVVDLVNDKSQKFDLVIYEPLTPFPLIFCETFKAPAIMFSSFYGRPDNFESVGAVSRHPTLYPHYLRNKYSNLSLIEKIYELYTEYEYYKFEKRLEKQTDQYLQERFGSISPVRELMERYVRLLLLNVHPIFDGNRPVPPGVVYLGALHLNPIKELPQDLKSYLDNSKRGVIYVSLGSNVRFSLMDADLVKVFIDAIEALPYDILWKYEADDLKTIPQNVKIQKWFPQRDLLGHLNIKLFITQGGLQSSDEAIDAGVPMVGIPFLGDQWFNVNKYEELGIGVALDAMTLTSADLINGVTMVLSNDSYRRNIQKLREVMKDQKETALERAIWWTEYVLRHKDSRYLLSRAADMSWSEYLMADVVLTLAATILSIFIIFLLVIYYIVRLFSSLTKYKTKKD